MSASEDGFDVGEIENSIYISPLPKHYTQKDIKRLFKKVGKVKNIVIGDKKDRPALIEFQKEKHALRAVKKLHGTKIEGGAQLTVCLSKDVKSKRKKRRKDMAVESFVPRSPDADPDRPTESMESKNRESMDLLSKQLEEMLQQSTHLRAMNNQQATEIGKLKIDLAIKDKENEKLKSKATGRSKERLKLQQMASDATSQAERWRRISGKQQTKVEEFRKLHEKHEKDAAENMNFKEEFEKVKAKYAQLQQAIYCDKDVAHKVIMALQKNKAGDGDEKKEKKEERRTSRERGRSGSKRARSGGRSRGRSGDRGRGSRSRDRSRRRSPPRSLSRGRRSRSRGRDRSLRRSRSRGRSFRRSRSMSRGRRGGY